MATASAGGKGCGGDTAECTGAQHGHNSSAFADNTPSSMQSSYSKLNQIDRMNKLSTNTLKRHPRMLELTKTELLELLTVLEGELQGREVVIAALRSDKAKQMLYQAKYGRFGLEDPYAALIRDATTTPDAGFDEGQVKAMYENQLQQLEVLIAQQKQAHQRMKEHLLAAEKRHQKVVKELEEERRKHAQDTATGDDVTYMLEKERERLQQELDQERGSNKKLERELRRTLAATEQAHARHKQVAVLLVAERRQLVSCLVSERRRGDDAERASAEQRERYEGAADALMEESERSLRLEAACERLQAHADAEARRWRAKLEDEAEKGRQLTAELAAARRHLEEEREARGAPASLVASKPYQRASATEMARAGVVPGTPAMAAGSRASVVQRSFVTHPAPSKATPVTHPTPSKATPAAHPVAATTTTTATTRPASAGAKTPTATVAPPRVATPSAAKPRGFAGASPSSPRPPELPPKQGSAGAGLGRGAPPPVPPNKPVLKAGGGSSQRVADSSSDIIVARSPGVAAPRMLGKGAPPADASEGDGSAKPPQVGGGGATEGEENLDIFGPELADLQQLLVSMVTGSSSSVEMDSSSPSIDIFAQMLYNATDSGDSEKLKSLLDESRLDVNTALGPIMTNAFVTASRKCHEECLRVLLEKGAGVNDVDSQGSTALHAAAANADNRCLRLLLDRGADAAMQDANGQTPLHLAASAGALECVKQLLMAAPAACIVKDKEGATPLHSAIQDDQPECLEVVIRRTKQLPLFSAHAPWHRKSPDKFIPYRSPYRKSPEKTAVKQLSVSDSTTPASRRSPERAPSIGELVDNSGNTMTHIAARLSSKECLEVLHAHNLVRLEDRCKAGQRPLDIASPTCRELLNDIESSEDRVCVVAMELDDTASGGYSDTAVVVGTVTVSGATTWPVLEDAVRNLVVAHFGAVGDGVRNRRANKSASDSADAGGGGEGEVVGLGLSFDSVRECAIGQKTWKVGEMLAGSPAESLQNSDTSQISVFLHGCEEGRLDNLSYDTLIPANTLQNYLRLIDQYRSLVFYGPSGVGKTYVAKKLAQFVQEKEQQAGNRCEITYVCLSETYTRRNLVNLLTSKDCLLPAEVPVPLCHTPVIILDDLSKIAVSEVFGDILTAIERRGPANAIAIKLDDGSEPQLYYLLADCYIIATMDKSRSQSLDLSIQQRFRWVHCRIDAEPVRSQLSRHLLRRLIHKYGGQVPASGDPVLRAVEWVFSVWQRLNECLAKLGLPELVFGPRHFFSCPIEMHKPKAILRWLSLSWNHAIAPAVENAILKGPKSSAPIGQQKLVETALFVLLQRAVLPGCPISGQDKDRYIGSFRGGQELQQHLQKVDETAVIRSDHNQPNSVSAGEGKPSDSFTSRTLGRVGVRSNPASDSEG